MRLPFLLHDFTRIIWHSNDARLVWASRLSRINDVWGKAERHAVVDGSRDACLTFVDPAHLIEVSAWAAKKDLVVLPLAQSGAAVQYSSTGVGMVPGMPWHYRIVLTQHGELAKEWIEAWRSQDNRRIGELLGYPSCCRDFFERVWVKDAGVDTSWEMAVNTPEGEVSGSSVRIKKDNSPIEANILLRWLGVRLVSHLPCSFTCAETVEHGVSNSETVRDIDEEAYDWIHEMLSWPVEWSALHGIAEVRTPVLTISTRTNATGPKYVVQREGLSYPEEGARGLQFPFRIQRGKVTSKPSFIRSVTPVHELNGFGSEDAMNQAHAVLLQVLPAMKPLDQVQVRLSLLDLGAGTGKLLERARAANYVVAGVELDNVRASAATIPLRRGDLFDTSLWAKDHWDVIVFMPGRLLEGCTQEKADEVRHALRTRANHVLLYAYGDWLKKFGGLGPLVAEAGLGAGDVVRLASGEGVEAALLRFTTTEDQHESTEEAQEVSARSSQGSSDARGVHESESPSSVSSVQTSAGRRESAWDCRQ